MEAHRRHAQRPQALAAREPRLRLNATTFNPRRRCEGPLVGATPSERLYVLSLGSEQGNAHVHWHVAPLPPGVAYERQQYAALMHENGFLDISNADQAALARSIGDHIEREVTEPSTNLGGVLSADRRSPSRLLIGQYVRVVVWRDMDRVTKVLLAVLGVSMSLAIGAPATTATAAAPVLVTQTI